MFGLGNGGGDARLRDHVEPPDVRGMLGDGRMVHGQVVDEDRRRPPSRQLLDRRALATAVTDDVMPYAVACELVDAPGMRLASEVSEDGDVSNLADTAQGFDRAGDEGLAMHLAAKEGVEQDPRLVERQRLARLDDGHR